MKICSKCNNENELDAEYCTNCGQPFAENPALTNEEESVSDKKPSLDIFVGKKADYYNRKWTKADSKNGVSFNVAAFFLSFLWLGYRKVYQPIILFAVAFLLIDLVLFLTGYEYSLTSLSNPLDQAISIGVTITFAMYGNAIYRSHAKKQIKIINESTPDEAEREKLYAKKGGTSWLGVLIGILIITFIYFIPSLFIPMNTNSIEEVQHTTIEYTENGQDYKIRFDEMLDNIFEDEKWDYTDKSTLGKEHVTFQGNYNEAGITNDIAITFFVGNDTDHIEITEFVVDDEDWYFDDQSEVLDYLLYLLD